MRSYRLSIYSLMLFAAGYPLLTGSVLVARWNSGNYEIYPFAPWTLFCFVPNQEVDYAVRLREIDGRALDPPPFLEDYSELTDAQKSVGHAIIQEMGRFAAAGDDRELGVQRQLLEQSFLSPFGREVRYEIVRRTYDVLDRWNSGVCRSVEPVNQFMYRADAGTL